MTVLRQLATFFEQAAKRRVHSQWLDDDKMKVYVRKGVHLLVLGDKLRTTLDIASVEVYEPGKGTFTDFIEKAHEMNPWDATFVESVVNNRLGAFLLKNWWTPAPPTISPDSYFMWKKHEEEM